MLRLQEQERELFGYTFSQMANGDVGVVISNDLCGMLVFKVNNSFVCTLGNSGKFWSDIDQIDTRVRIIPSGTTLVVE